MNELSGEPFEISKLIFKYLQEEISEDEKIVLEAWLNLSEGNRKWFEELTDKKILQTRWSSFYAGLEEQESARKRVFEGKVPGRMVRLRWIGLAAASVILMIVSFAVFTWDDQKEIKTIVAESQEQRFKNEVKSPGNNKAILTLDNGRKIYLDSVGNGTILSEKNVHVEKLDDGRIAYKQGPGSGAVVFNTLSNPRGSKVIDITLSDGSRVWLNNESSIQFPLAFSNDERKVVITGEAYFEVAKDAKRKFIVESNGVITEVLGTHFNINAYPGDPNITTTLLEGAVNVRKNAREVVLKPGQQSKVTGDIIQLISRADVEDVIAWKNGLIVFDHTDITAIFKQIERWYDVEIEVPGKLNVSEGIGELPRTMNLTDVLKVLEINSKLSFKIEGKKVTVLP